MVNKRLSSSTNQEHVDKGQEKSGTSSKANLAYVAEHQPHFYTIKDACMALRLGRTTVFSLLANRLLHRVRHGRRSLIPKASLDAYIAELMAQQGGDRG